MQQCLIIQPLLFNTRLHFRYFPRSAAHQSRPFGIQALQLNQVTSTASYTGILAALLATMACGAGAVPAVVLKHIPEPIWFAASAILSVVYFGQVRSHGLVHNKADLVPWTLLALIGGGDGDNGSIFCAQLLLGLAYGSSGLYDDCSYRCFYNRKG